MRRSFAVGSLTGVLLVALAAVGYAGIQGGDRPVGSDRSVSDPSWQRPPPPVSRPPSRPEEPRSRVVTPRPGMASVHRVRWERAERLDDWTVRIHFWTGVEPCAVLDRVEVGFTGHEVRIALFEGTDPAATDVACIQLAVLKAVDVRLRQPLAGRTVVDALPR